MRYFIATLCLFLTASASPAEDALPHHTILRAAGPIAVDGHLDEPSWEAAEVIEQFAFPWWTEGAKDRTEARLLWDDVHLYVAFTAHDPHISATLTERDSPVSRDDCVEVFIAPDTSQVTNYFNFEFNALGTILDRSPHADRSSAWNGEGVQVAIKRRIRIRSGLLRLPCPLPYSIHTLLACPRPLATRGVSICTARAARSICSTSLGLIP